MPLDASAPPLPVWSTLRHEKDPITWLPRRRWRLSSRSPSTLDRQLLLRQLVRPWAPPASTSWSSARRTTRRPRVSAATSSPVEITIYEDRSFTFILKTPPAAELIKKAAGIKKGTENPLTHKVGKISRDQVREIANTKMPDLNANSVETAMKIVEGTARSMGVTVEG